MKKILKWLDSRLPIISLSNHFSLFPTPNNLNYWWTFGGILSFCLLSQIATGIVLAMNYVAHVDFAFDSIQRIKREVLFGWLLQPWHAVGASMFFMAVYAHIIRALYYGSYKSPREIVWILGCCIYFLMMAVAFMGYVLPWGQMSLWGAQVITNFFTAIPIVGESIRIFLLGGSSVSNATLNRFFSLHYFLPFVICFFVVLHVWSVHAVGNNNPLGIKLKKESDYVAFHPYYTVKDLFAVSVFCIVFAFFVFFYPDYLGHPDNYQPGNYLKTPPHIVPEWYFLLFYGILKSIPYKSLGVLVMFCSIFVFFILPWLDRSQIRSMRFRPITRVFLFLFIICCFMLALSGAKQPTDQFFLGITYLTLGQICTVYYFFYFFVVLPFFHLFDKKIDVRTLNVFLHKSSKS